MTFRFVLECCGEDLCLDWSRGSYVIRGIRYLLILRIEDVWLTYSRRAKLKVITS